jgi:hypothetical protein
MKKFIKNIVNFLRYRIVRKEDFEMFFAKVRNFFASIEHYLETHSLSEMLKIFFRSTLFQAGLITITLLAMIKLFSFQFNRMKTVDRTQENILTNANLNYYDYVRAPNGKYVLLKRKQIVDGKSYIQTKDVNKIFLDIIKEDLGIEEEQEVVENKTAEPCDLGQYKVRRNIDREVEMGYKYEIDTLSKNRSKPQKIKVLYVEDTPAIEAPYGKYDPDAENVDFTRDEYRPEDHYRTVELDSYGNTYDAKFEKKEKVYISTENVKYLDGHKDIKSDIYIENVRRFKTPEGVKIRGNIYLRNVSKFEVGDRNNIDGNIIVVENSSIAPIDTDNTRFNGNIVIQ